MKAGEVSCVEPSQVRGEECREAGRFCEERAGSGRAGGTGGLWHHAHLRALPCREVRRWGRAEGGVPGLRVLRYGSGTTSWTGAFLQLLPETQPQQRRAAALPELRALLPPQLTHAAALAKEPLQPGPWILICPLPVPHYTALS